MIDNDMTARLSARLRHPEFGFGYAGSVGQPSGPPGLYLSHYHVADRASGAIARLIARQFGAATFSKLSGSSVVSVASDGTVSLSAPINHGEVLSFTARATSGGKTVDADLTLTGKLAGLYNFSASQFAQYKAALARVAGGTGRARVLGLGSSTMRGWGTGTGGNYLMDARRHGWFPKLAARHIARGIQATGEGFLGAGNGTGILSGLEAAMTLNSWTASNSANPSIGGRAFNRTTNASTMLFTPAIAWNTCKVWYQQDTGLGSFQLKIAAGAYGSAINTAGASALVETSVASGGAAASQALTVNKSAGAGACYIQGFLPYDSAVPAVDFIPAGRPSTGPEDLTFNQSIGWGTKLAIPVVNPDLIVLQYSTVEFSTPLDPSVMYTRMIQAIDMIRSVSSADILLVTLNPPREAAYGARSWQPYVDVLYQVALARNLPLFDSTVAVFGGRWISGTRALMYDDLHALETAAELYADNVDRVLQLGAA